MISHAKSMQLSSLNWSSGELVPPGRWSASKEEFARFLLERGYLLDAEADELRLMLYRIEVILEELASYRPRYLWVSGPVASSFSGFQTGEIAIECDLSYAKELAEYRTRQMNDNKLSICGKVVTPAVIPDSILRLAQLFEEANSCGLFLLTCFAFDQSLTESGPIEETGLASLGEPQEALICVAVS